MSIKSTQTITRSEAMNMVLLELPMLPNRILADILNLLSDSEQSQNISLFDNFIVTE
jgi:hypothetical protein